MNPIISNRLDQSLLNEDRASLLITGYCRIQYNFDGLPVDVMTILNSFCEPRLENPPEQSPDQSDIHISDDREHFFGDLHLDGISIICHCDVLHLNVIGNLILDSEGHLSSVRAKSIIILNVTGTITLRHASRIEAVDNGNIYIKCKAMNIGWFAGITTHNKDIIAFGVKSQMKEMAKVIDKGNREWIYGNVIIEVEDHLLIHRGVRITSGSVRIQSGKTISFAKNVSREWALLIALRENLWMKTDKLLMGYRAQVDAIRARGQKNIQCSEMICRAENQAEYWDDYGEHYQNTDEYYNDE